MAQLVKAAQAGFDEKNDALVTVEPIASGIEIELTSKVIRQYGDQIKSVVLNTVKEAGFDGVKVIVQDKMLGITQLKLAYQAHWKGGAKHNG